MLLTLLAPLCLTLSPAVEITSDTVLDPAQTYCLTLGFDSWGAPPLRIWIDGLAWKSAREE